MSRRCLEKIAVFAALLFPLLAALAAAEPPGTPAGPGDPQAMVEVNHATAEFDQIRSLLCRALMRAQDFKLACLYGRSWGLDMPEHIPEDMLIEGLWIFDYLEGLDISSSALVSYGIASQHPNLSEEIAAFRRSHGGRTDAELREAVSLLERLVARPPAVTVIGAADMRKFLAERGARGITINCEDSDFLPAAERLAHAIQQAYGKKVRISRNAPRIKANRPLFGCGAIGQAHDLLEQPDILLGGRHSSHFIARLAVTMMANNTLPLPFMATKRFPGNGRAIVALTRPYVRLWSPGRPAMDETVLFREQDAPQALAISASDAVGVAQGVDSLVKLMAEK